MAEVDQQLQRQLKALGISAKSQEGVAFSAMDAKLRQELTNQLLVPGTKEANQFISKYNEGLQKRQTEQEGNKDLDARIAKALEGQPPEVHARVAGLRDPAQINRVIREYNAEQEAKALRTGAITAGSVATGLGGGLLGAKLADYKSNAAIKRQMAARSGAITEAANSLRAIPQAGAPEDVLRAQYGDVVKGLKTGRVVPYGAYGTGAALLGMGGYSSFDRAPNAKSDTERAIWTGTGYGEMGAGGKMLFDTYRRHMNPEVAYPQADLGAVNAARRMTGGGIMTPIPPPANAPPAPAPGAAQAPLSPGGADLRQQRMDTLNAMTKAQLQEMAKKRGLPVSGNKPDILGRIADHMERNPGAAPTPKGGKISSILGPLGAGIAGVTAFDAANSQARAEGSSPEEATVRGLKSGALAGGATAGTYYGATKGMEYVGRKLAESAAGRAALRMVPYAGGALLVKDAYDLINQPHSAVLDRPEDYQPPDYGNPQSPRYDPARMREEQSMRRNLEAARAEDQRQVAELMRRRQQQMQAPLFMPQ